MSVVSVRVPDEVEAYLRGHGLSPGIFARELIEREVKMMRLKESLRRLAAGSRKPSKPILDLLREDRDAH